MKELIPTLAVMILTSLVTIFSTTLNIANAISNELQDSPLPFLPSPQQPQSQLSQPQQQQQMNQPPLQNPLNASRISNSHNNIFDNHSPTIVSILPF
jgi:hypothetical protein